MVDLGAPLFFAARACNVMSTVLAFMLVVAAAGARLPPDLRKSALLLALRLRILPLVVVVAEEEDE